MRKSVYILGIVFLFNIAHGYAQHELTYLLNRDGAYQLIDDHTPHLNPDIENNSVYLMRKYTALINFQQSLSDSSIYFKSEYRPNANILRGDFHNANTVGKYLSYAGNRTTNGCISASGTYKTINGTLFGNIAYTYSGKDGVMYNYATQPENYAPYLIGDSVSQGRLYQEIYGLKGGYSFQHNKLNYGIDAFYEGIAQSRSDNPKQSNFSYWLRLGLSLAYIHKHHLYALKITPELNRQSIAANTVSDGIRFFQFYGFGQWHRRESKGSLSYARTQSIHGMTAELMFQKDKKDCHDWNATIYTQYNYQHAKTEETTFKNLFELHSHRLRQQMVLSKSFPASFLFMQLSGYERFRHGTENIYENQIQNQSQYLFNAIKVGNSRLYKANEYNFDVRAKYVFTLPQKRQLHLMVGTSYFSYQENYASPRMKISNRTFTPMLTTGYAMEKSKTSFSAELFFATRQGMKSHYSIPTPFDKFVDAHAYTPYLLRGNNTQQTAMHIAIARNLKEKNKLGIETAVSYTHTDYQEIIVTHCGLFFIF